MLGFVLGTVFALSAVLVSSASAEPTLLAVWLVKGTEVAAGAEVATETSIELLLADTKTIAGVAAIKCSYILDGFVFANGWDLITAILPLGGGTAIGELVGSGMLCEGTDSSACVSTADAEVWPLNLPWPTLLVLKEVSPNVFMYLVWIYNARWHELCLNALGGNMEDECEVAANINPTGILVENLAGGTVSTPSGETAEPLGTCTLGGAGSAEQTTIGESVIKTVSGESLEVFSE